MHRNIVGICTLLMEQNLSPHHPNQNMVEIENNFPSCCRLGFPHREEPSDADKICTTATRDSIQECLCGKARQGCLHDGAVQSSIVSEVAKQHGLTADQRASTCWATVAEEDVMTAKRVEQMILDRTRKGELSQQSVSGGACSSSRSYHIHIWSL